jgi:hypothetical protein
VEGAVLFTQISSDERFVEIERRPLGFIKELKIKVE